ncbi:hypothetical protein FJQ98_20420 [Lysinibacillus agricola]|uniref:Uncharacterized protein n=1 Tax=Lysinibacillus agricola TaxID=2590012 RepID=A0ABX7ATK3_9BACI|nr:MULTISPECIES: hypothetical protein [Lysinibacillus]QQP11539.1 hypothetical protein FJQ98_20420 [Lysinibacillus agricola]
MPALHAKGQLKIELVDASTGELVQEIGQHNFIANDVLTTLFAAAINNIFTYRRAVDSQEVLYQYYDMFGRIILTDAAHPEDPSKEWLINGNTIGWASSSEVFTGADPLRGTVNIAETVNRWGYVKLVFDFPTNAANGEIKSVYFGPPDGRAPYTNNKGFAPLSGAYAVSHSENKYYVAKSSGVYVYSDDWVLLGKFPWEGFSNYSDIKQSCIVDGFIYFICDKSTYTIIKASLDSPGKITKVKDFGNGYTGGILYNEKTQEFVVANYPSSARELMYFDQTFNELRREPILTTDPSYSKGQLSYFEDGMIMGSWFVKGAKAWRMTENNVLLIHDGWLFSSGYMHRKMSMFGSRALLANPITKTDKQVMKITYEFIPPLN